MSKSGYLVKNTGILAIGNFSSKLLTFLLVPLYTAVLTTAEYGIYDIINSSVSLLIPILTLNVQDAVMRFPLEKDEDIPAVARVGLLITLGSGAVVLAAQLVPGTPWSSTEGIGYLAALYLFTALYQMLSLLARGTEHIADIAVAGVVSTIVIVTLNILLLIVFPMGLDGYFIANISGFAISSAFLLVRLRAYVFGRTTSPLASLAARMVRYSIPLAAAVIGWWFINTSGRYIVIWVCGAGANGLFSVAYKIPTILNTLAQIFLQAWQVSAIKDFDPADKDGFLRRTFDAVELLLVVASSVLIMLSPALAVFLYQGDFYSAWEYVPFLMVSVLANSMGGMWGPFFSATYHTRPMATATVVGGIVNVAAGVPLTMIMGVQGAAVAAMLASLANWAWRGWAARGVMQVSFHIRRSVLLYGLLAAQGALTVSGLPVPVWVAGDLAILAAILIVCRKSIRASWDFLIGAVRRRDA